MTMTPLIVLCPGQGAQAVGMGRAWADASPEAKRVFDRADAILGNRFEGPLSSLCFQGPMDRLSRTDISQPAIYVASIACWAGLMAARGLGHGEAELAATAGLSLGEYTALVIAGAITFDDGLELVALRGRAMQDAADSPEARAGGGGGMVALVGATDDQAREICDKARGGHVLVCANFNAPGQVVLSGHKSACEAAGKVAEGMGLRFAMLQVAGAFHSPLMAPAAETLGTALNATAIATPKCPVLSNVTAVPHVPDAANIRAGLVAQLTQPVRWAHGCQWLAAHSKGDYCEVAPGRTLAGLMRRINKEIKVVNHDTP